MGIRSDWPLVVGLIPSLAFLVVYAIRILPEDSAFPSGFLAVVFLGGGMIGALAWPPRRPAIRWTIAGILVCACCFGIYCLFRLESAQGLEGLAYFVQAMWASWVVSALSPFLLVAGLSRATKERSADGEI